MARFHTALYGHRPIAKLILMWHLDEVSAAVLYPALSCKPEPAGPDGIRRERPHLSHALEAHGRVQVCVLAVRPVSPSQLNQPQQPTDASTFPLPTLASRSRSLSGTPGLAPELPTQFEQSYMDTARSPS